MNGATIVQSAAIGMDIISKPIYLCDMHYCMHWNLKNQFAFSFLWRNWIKRESRTKSIVGTSVHRIRGSEVKDKSAIIWRDIVRSYVYKYFSLRLTIKQERAHLSLNCWNATESSMQPCIWTMCSSVVTLENSCCFIFKLLFVECVLSLYNWCLCRHSLSPSARFNARTHSSCVYLANSYIQRLLLY